jgi:hypothetical protein
MRDGNEPRESMLDMESRRQYMLKEIDLIEDTVKRMASNSFVLKGWAVTLVVGVFLLDGPGILQLLLSLIPVLVFWFLDAYFLRQERLFRRLYVWVVQNRMVTEDNLFDMSAERRFGSEVPSLWRTMLGNQPTQDGIPKINTLRWFYSSLAFLSGVYGLVLILLQRGGR